MKHFCCVAFLLLIAGHCCKAQAPAYPTGCITESPTPTLNISGSTSFTFTSLNDFATSRGSNNITLTIQSKTHVYKLYVAGIITSLPASSTNTVIPIGTFTVGASTPGSGVPSSVTLSNSYLEIATGGPTTGNSTLSQTITITLNPVGNMDSFKQAPGTHVLTLYFCLCN
jgi:hypothetical protein